MRKKRDKKDTFPHQPENLESGEAADSIRLFLLLAIILLAANIIPSHLDYLQGYRQQPATTAAKKYVWLTGSTAAPDGLYLLSQDRMRDPFPAVAKFLTRKKPRSAGSLVTAIQFDADGLPAEGRLPPAVAIMFFRPISINRADAVLLQSLPGIGPLLAAKIVQRRKQLGVFAAKEELLRIRGIGPKKFAGLVDRITLD